MIELLSYMIVYLLQQLICQTRARAGVSLLIAGFRHFDSIYGPKIPFLVILSDLIVLVAHDDGIFGRRKSVIWLISYEAPNRKNRMKHLLNWQTAR